MVFSNETERKSAVSESSMIPQSIDDLSAKTSIRHRVDKTPPQQSRSNGKSALEEGLLEDKVPELGESSSPGATFNFITAAVGVGVMQLPNVFKQLGLVNGLILLVLATICSAKMCILLGVQMDLLKKYLKTEVTSLDGVAKTSFRGAKWAFLATILVTLIDNIDLLMTCTYYLMTCTKYIARYLHDWEHGLTQRPWFEIGNMADEKRLAAVQGIIEVGGLAESAESFVEKRWTGANATDGRTPLGWGSYEMWAVIIVFFCVLVTSSFKDMSLLEKTSFIGVIGAVVSTLTVVVTGIVMLTAGDGLAKNINFVSMAPLADAASKEGKSELQKTFEVCASAFAAVWFSYALPILAPSIKGDMRRKGDYVKAVNWSHLSTFIVYVLIASIGYLAFGDQLTDDFVKDLMPTGERGMPSEGGFSTLDGVKKTRAIASVVVCAGLILNVLVTYPLFMFPLAQAVEKLLGVSEIDSDKKPWVEFFSRIATRTFLVLSTIGLGYVSPSFYEMQALVGAVTAMFTCVYLPVVLFYVIYFRFYKRVDIKGERLSCKIGNEESDIDTDSTEASESDMVFRRTPKTEEEIVEMREILEEDEERVALSGKIYESKWNFVFYSVLFLFGMMATLGQLLSLFGDELS